MSAKVAGVFAACSFGDIPLPFLLSVRCNVDGAAKSTAAEASSIVAHAMTDTFAKETSDFRVELLRWRAESTWRVSNRARVQRDRTIHRGNANRRPVLRRRSRLRERLAREGGWRRSKNVRGASDCRDSDQRFRWPQGAVNPQPVFRRGARR